MPNKVRSLLLSGGLGTRLGGLTMGWPKCLMPIQGRPLLDYWINNLLLADIDQIYVNVHHHKDKILNFLSHYEAGDKICCLEETELLGTAGTLQNNHTIFEDGLTLLIHADNWCHANLKDFIFYHKYLKPKDCLITMMIFESPNPQSCGIVEINDQGVVTNFFEKVRNPPGNIANGAVFIVEPEVIRWVKVQNKLVDFSAEVIPNFIGRIATWKNNSVHRDIGTIGELQASQIDRCHDAPKWNIENWQYYYEMMNVAQLIERERTANNS